QVQRQLAVGADGVQPWAGDGGSAASAGSQPRERVREQGVEGLSSRRGARPAASGRDREGGGKARAAPVLPAPPSCFFGDILVGGVPPERCHELAVTIWPLRMIPTATSLPTTSPFSSNRIVPDTPSNAG